MKITGANLIDFYVLINRGEITKMFLVPQSAWWLVLKEKMAILLVWLHPLGKKKISSLKPEQIASYKNRLEILRIYSNRQSSDMSFFPWHWKYAYFARKSAITFKTLHQYLKCSHRWNYFTENQITKLFFLPSFPSHSLSHHKLRHMWLLSYYFMLFANYLSY